MLPIDQRNITEHTPASRFCHLDINSFSEGLYNVVRVHSTIETTPAHQAGLTDHAWQWEELLTFRLPPERQFQLMC
jgi:hypothetical protein